MRIHPYLRCAGRLSLLALICLSLRAAYAGSAQMAAEQQGTVIGVQGEHTLDGEPILCLVVQLWPEKHGDVPNVIFVPKPTFNAYLCLSHTVEEAPPYEGDPAAGA